MCGSQTAICASRSSNTSEGENCLARNPAIRSIALRSCSEVTACSDSVLCMGACRESGFYNAGEHAGADRQDLVVEDIAGIVHGHIAVMAEPEIRAGHDMKHVREIFTAHFRRGPGEDLCRVDDGACDLFDDL